MKISILTFASSCLIAVAAGSVEDGDSEGGHRGLTRGGRRCGNPKKAVLDLLECVSNTDAACAAAAYDPGFQRFHNEVFTGPSAVSDPAFWGSAFSFFPTFQFDIKFARNVGKNLASVRYIETVISTDGTNLGILGAPLSDFPYQQTVVQYEHALVKVDNDCKLVKWEQYGDNKEQSDVDTIIFTLLCATNPSIPGCTGAI